MSKLRVAVVGAGVSGASLVSLVHQDTELVLFEKSRGIGGRLSTRRVEGIGSFDHGAQFFTCRTQQMQPLVQDLLEKGCIEAWQGPLLRIDASTGQSEQASPGPRYVGVGKAARLVQELLSDSSYTLRLETEVAKVTRQDQTWLLADHTGATLGSFDILVLSTPPQQAAALLRDIAGNSLVQRLESVPMTPCWCLLLYWPETSNLPFAGAFIENSPLAWIARNETKPGRSAAPGELWTVHAAGPWSVTRGKEERTAVEQEMCDAFLDLIGRKTKPHWMQSHYWHYAQAMESQSEACYWDPQLNLGLCGDWFPAGRIEGSFLSGWHLAQHIKTLD